jgi:hypothetical protein
VFLQQCSASLKGNLYQCENFRRFETNPSLSTWNHGITTNTYSKHPSTLLDPQAQPIRRRDECKITWKLLVFLVFIP